MALGGGKTQISAVLEDQYISALDFIRRKEERSRSYVIRLAIIEYLEKRKAVIEDDAAQGIQGEVSGERHRPISS